MFPNHSSGFTKIKSKIVGVYTYITANNFLFLLIQTIAVISIYFKDDTSDEPNEFYKDEV